MMHLVMPAWAILICSSCVGSSSAFHGFVLAPLPGLVQAIIHFDSPGLKIQW
ncbi:uncharacterized protein BDW47DRAFT_114313 [Aspergillus candidus]|uniref:Uncharacterized protein n=1 Tax=Aspergillus candidus TaxID=41067 RepID=A0A2I2EXW5_ASPCN|nr:hypothetical protein BDW47DRAFT_114313 [Aspergillus candidus]PLB33236.1 hypothetical protein BDW47DRAFT_114313 [Aspergillus candidus]